MAVFVPVNKESSFYYLTTQVESGLLGRFYGGPSDSIEIEKPKPVSHTYDSNSGKTDKNGKPLAESKVSIDLEPKFTKKGRPSLFNRYEIFYFDNFSKEPNGEAEPLFDAPDRLKNYLSTASGLSYTDVVLKNPTSQNIINWSKQSTPGTGAIEYAWEDFLWCKNYGIVPNNYMVTLRRFAMPVTDNIISAERHPAPDIARMISWVDGETNKWESVGLKFSTSLTWKEFESEIQVVQRQDGEGTYGNEGGMFGGSSMIGGLFKNVSKLLDTNKATQNREQGNRESINPYQDSNKVYGPIDVIKKMYMREKGINFEQTFTLTFEYEMRSIDGINARLAFMDLFANVLMMVTNKATFWGGDIKYWGGHAHREVSPLGNPQHLADGNYGKYFESLLGNIRAKVDALTKGASFFSEEGMKNFFSGIGGNLMDNIVGGGLDKAGRPGAQALNSLLTGNDTGMWHVMVGNPANPIISVGNLIMEKADIDFDGILGPDDFPTKLKVVCTLKPARPRERIGIMDMFHRNGRVYTTYDPSKLGDKSKKSKQKKELKRKNPSLSQVGNSNPNPDNDAAYNEFITSIDNKEFKNENGVYQYRFSNWNTGAAIKNTYGNVTDIVLNTAAGIF
jgi:hypothetical protein